MKRQKHQKSISSSAPGNERFLTWYDYRCDNPSAKTMYLQASLHADEWPGMVALQHLMPKLDEIASAGKLQCNVIVVPYANPIGLAQWMGGIHVGRYAFDGSGNFNRTWPALADIIDKNDLWQSTGDVKADEAAFRNALGEAVNLLPERTENDELRKALLSLSAQADYVLDLHCDGQALLHLYANYRHQATAERLSRALGVAVLMLEEDAGGNPFDEANASPWWHMRDRNDAAKALPNGCFACTVELRGKMDIDDRYGAQDALGILNFMQAEGLIARDVKLEPLPEKDLISTKLEAIALQFAPVTGLVVYHVDVGDMVEEGQHIADILDVSGDGSSEYRTSIYAQTSGLLFTKEYGHYVRKGTGFLKIAGDKVLDSRKSGDLLND